MTVGREDYLVKPWTSRSVLGYSFSELAGHPLESIIAQRSRAHARRVLDTFRTDDRQVWHGTSSEPLWGLSKDESESPIRLSIASFAAKDVLIGIEEIGTHAVDPTRFLSYAPAELATSFDVEEVLARSAATAARMFDDYVFIEVAPSLSTGRAVRCASRWVSDRAAARRLEEHWAARGGAFRYGGGRTDSRPMIVSAAADETLADLRPYSVMTSPLYIGQDRVGSISFLATMKPARPYERRDLTFATSLATIISGALATVRRVQRAEALASQREEWMKTIAHELGSASAALRLWTQLVASRGAGLSATDVGKALAPLAVRLDRLVADLRDASEMDSGSFTVAPLPDQSAPELVALAWEAGRARAHAHTLEMEIDATRPLPMVRADRERILQVLANLVDNAVKFTPAGGTIAIGARASSDGQRAVFSVRDTGIGISELEQQRVFERGWRAGTRNAPGFGLGLAISKALVEAHGGTMTFATRLGAGSTFSFSLPADPPGNDTVRRTSPIGNSVPNGVASKARERQEGERERSAGSEGATFDSTLGASGHEATGGAKSREELRDEAKARLKRIGSTRAQQTPPDEQARLIHELEVHQVELQLQNDALRRAEAEAEDSRDRYRSLYDEAPFAYMTLERDGTIVDANLTAAELLGIARDQLVGLRLSSFMDHAAGDRFHVQREILKQTGTKQSCDLRLERRDGETIYTRLDMSLDRSVRQPLFKAVLVNLSDLRSAQDELRASEGRFRQIAEGIEDVFSIRELDGVVSYVSPAFEKIWGRPVHWLAGRQNAWLDSVDPEDRARVAAAFARIPLGAMPFG